MLLKKIYVSVIAISLIAPFAKLHAKGAKIILHLKAGEQISSKLYSVNDSSLVLYTQGTETETNRAVMFREIQKVALPEKPEVKLILKDGQQISGLLDSVNDSSLIISGKDGKNEIISNVSSEEIQAIVFEGDSKILDGMGLGLLIGAGTGALIGFVSGDDDESEFLRFSAGEKALMGGIILGGAGLIVGAVAGAATSTGDKEIEFTADRPFSLLKPLARHSKSKSQDK